MFVLTVDALQQDPLNFGHPKEAFSASAAQLQLKSLIFFFTFFSSLKAIYSSFNNMLVSSPTSISFHSSWFVASLTFKTKISLAFLSLISYVLMNLRNIFPSISFKCLNNKWTNGPIYWKIVNVKIGLIDLRKYIWIFKVFLFSKKFWILMYRLFFGRVFSYSFLCGRKSKKYFYAAGNWARILSIAGKRVTHQELTRCRTKLWCISISIFCSNFTKFSHLQGAFLN